MPSTLDELQSKWAANAQGGKARALQALQDSETAAGYIKNFNREIGDLNDIGADSAQAIKWALAVGSEAFDDINPGETYEFTVDGDDISYLVPDWSDNFDEGLQNALDADSWSRGMKRAVERTADNVSLDVDL